VVRYGDVQPGQWIETGHFIGVVGNSGNAKGTPPHLHYGIYGFFGAAIDPYPLFRTERWMTHTPPDMLEVAVRTQASVVYQQ
jgi:murein DD-endopeptidase MepM/ murein hydrolase activator NlpD